jgi:polyhydroxyalkanoate synthesis repressor PhaR
VLRAILQRPSKEVSVAEKPPSEPKPASAGAPPSDGPQKPVVIKKYANRRLYNTSTSSYVTLDHLSAMVKQGIDFAVQDAKSGDDITRSVLTQIIFEEESKGQNLLPINFLRQLIRFYGDSLQVLVPGYLEMSMESFSRNGEQMRQYMTEAFGGMFPFRQLEEVGRQNMAMLTRAISMFNPFVAGQKEGAAPATPGDPVSALEKRLEEMQRQIDALSKK